jgi:hypothetical protein
VLTDNQNPLSRRDVVARTPVVIAIGVEILLYELLSSREPVSSAHVRDSLSQDE